MGTRRQHGRLMRALRMSRRGTIAAAGVALVGGAPSGIFHQGTPSLVEQASGTTLTIPIPSGVTVGETLVVGLVHAASGAIAAPTGWTRVNQATVYQGGNNCALYYKAVAGGEGSFVVPVSNGRSTGIMHRFSGINTTTPIDAGSTVVGTGDCVTWQLPGITTVTAGTLLFGVMASTLTTATVVKPTGTTLGAIDTGVGYRMATAYETRATAGATGDRYWTINPTTTVTRLAGVMTAFRPA